MLKFKTQSGITLIEVMTAIVVALIGVFGVMVMIPFAVRQAQTGLDKDAATVVARNAFAQFEIMGYRAVGEVRDTTTGELRRELNWTLDGVSRMLVDPDDTPGDTTDPGSNFPNSVTHWGGAICIDPLGVTENGAYDTFPFNALPPLPSAGYKLALPSVNLLLPNGSMQIATARRMFRSSDDLVFGESIETVPGDGDAELNGPTQVFDAVTGVPAARRQFHGNFSWCAIVVPVKDDYTTVGPTGGWKYRMHVLVFKDRPTVAVSSPLVDGDGTMLTAPLAPTLNIGQASPLSVVYPVPPVDSSIIHKDDWVMLINRVEWDTMVKPTTTAEKGFNTQIAFARVVNTSSDSVNATRNSVTLDGPDFNFGDPGRTDASIDPDELISETHIVHLKNVVGVYERTFTLEGSSNWNISQ